MLLVRIKSNIALSLFPVFPSGACGSGAGAQGFKSGVVLCG